MSRVLAFSKHSDDDDYQDSYSNKNSEYGEYAPLARKKKRKKKTKEKEKQPISTEYSDALNQISDISLDDVETNLDLLKAMRKTLIATLATARGAFKVKPSPSNVYALARVVKDIQEITRAIETAFDYEEFTNILFTEVIQPFVERSLLDLGSQIKDTLEKYAGDNPNRFKKLEKVMTEAYRKYGASLEGQIPSLKTRLRKTVLKNVK